MNLRARFLARLDCLLCTMRHKDRLTGIGSSFNVHILAHPNGNFFFIVVRICIRRRVSQRATANTPCRMIPLSFVCAYG